MPTGLAPASKGNGMNKGKIARLVGFVGALGISAALVAGAVSSTGAYFTSSADGSLAAGPGHLTLNVTDTNLSFANLVPGEDKTLNIGYSTDSSSNSDLWMVFADAADYCAFTGAADDTHCSDGGLGRFGHFAVAQNNSNRFISYNLKNAPAGVTGTSCGVDGNGNGGSGQQSTSVGDTPPYCGVPLAIKLASNLSSGSSGEIETTFGITGRWTSQVKPVAQVAFKIVATQVNVRPDALNY
jgi:hypothetical protein